MRCIYCLNTSVIKTNTCLVVDMKIQYNVLSINIAEDMKSWPKVFEFSLG